MMDEELMRILFPSSSIPPTPAFSSSSLSMFYENELLNPNSSINSSQDEILKSTSSSGFGTISSSSSHHSSPSYNDSGGGFEEYPNSNNTSGTWNSTSDLMDLDWAKIILAILFCGIIAGTVIGNTLVIAAVATTKKLRTVTNCFVMSLALADWLVGMFVMPPKVLVHLSGGGWKFGSLVCQIWIFLDVLLCTSSILSLCTISIDRYLAITRPLAYSRRRRSKRLALGMISCVWIASFVITCPPMFGGKNESHGTDSQPLCEYNDDVVYVVYSALGSFFLPLLVMLYVYARIACVIARRQKTIQKLHKSKDKDKKYCDSDDTLPADGLIPPNATKHETTTTPTSSLRLTTKLRQTQSSSSTGSTIKFLKRSKITPRNGSSIWSRFRRLKSGNNSSSSSSRKWKANNSPLGVGTTPGTGVGDKDDVVDPSQVPSPSTILGMVGNGGGNNGNSHHHHHPHNHNKIITTTLSTGSRLCHHSITTPSSPPRCIINNHNTLLRNSSDNDTFTRSHHYQHHPLPHHHHHPATRVWTIGDEDHENRQELITHSNLSLGGGNSNPMSNYQCSCSNNLIGTNSIDDLTKSRGHNHHAYGQSTLHQTTRFSIMKENRFRTIATTQPLQHSTRQSSCGQLLGDPTGTGPMTPSPSPSNTRTNSIVVRSKSIKGNINFTVSKNDQNQNSNTVGREFTTGRVASFKRESKTAQTLAAVVGGFVICWLPFFVAYVVNPISGTKTIPDTIMEAFVWLGWSNSFINPFIYSFYSTEFRSAFWRLTFHKCSGLFNCKKKNSGLGAGGGDRTSPKKYEHEMNPQNQNIRTSPN